MRETPCAKHKGKTVMENPDIGHNARAKARHNRFPASIRGASIEASHPSSRIPFPDRINAMQVLSAGWESVTMSLKWRVRRAPLTTVAMAMVAGFVYGRMR
jgi:hypothetical protein